MPAVLASAGTMSLAVLLVIAAGAMLLAVLFGQLTKRVPNSDGGLCAYARHEFGDFAGYLTGWCYWVQAWAGNAAIVASWVFHVEALFKINSFIGVEVAAITAKRVRDPRRNVGRASLLGTGLSAIVYVAVSAAIMGLVPQRALVNNGAPFVTAFQAMPGSAS